MLSNMNLKDLPDMSDALKAVQMYEKKKLDPVGKEDGDIDNDGDVDSSDSYLKNRRKAIGKAIKKEEVEVEEGYKGKHGQSDKEYAASRSQGGKMISGDDKMSGAEYTHGRRVKAANPGMQPDVGGKTKPKSQGKMDRGTRADLQYRKANLKKEEVESVEEGKFSGSKSHIQRDGTASAPERTAAERKKDRRILAGYGKGGMQDAVARAKKERDERRAARKEAFAFSEEEFELFEQYGEEIDALTDEQLIDVMEDYIIETAEDIDDLIEICEHLDAVEMLTEEERDAGAMARAKLNKPAGPSRMDRIKSAAKEAGSRLKAGAEKAGAAAKKGIKAAGKSVSANAGKAVGTFQANRIKAKRAELSKPAEKKPAPKSSSSDDDGTGGKLDKLLAKTRGTSSSSSGGSSSGGGGESSSSSGGSSSGGEKKPGLLRRIGGAIKRGLKKAVGKTSRLVSKGSDKLAKRLGEDYDTIAHLHESGLFSLEEIENIVEMRFDDGPEGTAKRKKALEKKRGMKLDGHPQFDTKRGAMAYDGPNKAASDAKDRVIAKTKAKREGK